MLKVQDRLKERFSNTHNNSQNNFPLTPKIKVHFAQIPGD